MDTKHPQNSTKHTRASLLAASVWAEETETARITETIAGLEERLLIHFCRKTQVANGANVADNEVGLIEKVWIHIVVLVLQCRDAHGHCK